MKLLKFALVSAIVVTILSACSPYRKNEYNHMMRVLYSCNGENVHKADNMCVKGTFNYKGSAKGEVPVTAIQEALDAATLISANRKDYDRIIEVIREKLTNSGAAAIYMKLRGRHSAVSLAIFNHPDKSHLRVVTTSTLNAFPDSYTVSY